MSEDQLICKVAALEAKVEEQQKENSELKQLLEEKVYRLEKLEWLEENRSWHDK